MNEYEFTSHALFRYAQRVKGEALINQASYIVAEKAEASKYNEYKNEVESLFSASKFITTGSFDSKNSVSDFYLHKDSKIIFVCNSENKKVITCYLVDFGFGDVVNTSTMTALLKEMYKKKAEKEKYVLKNNKDLELKANAIKNIESEINLLQEKINLLNTQKEIIRNEISIYDSTVSIMDKEINSKANAICYSIGFKVKEEFI